MLPIVEAFVKDYKLDDFIVVAACGLIEKEAFLPCFSLCNIRL
jgi:hypothetical protein